MFFILRGLSLSKHLPSSTQQCNIHPLYEYADLHDLQTVRKTVWIPLSVSGGPYHCNRQTENMTATLALALTELYSLFSHSFNFVPIRVVLTHMQRFIGAGCGLDSPSFQSINEPVNSDNLLSSCQPRWTNKWLPLGTKEYFLLVSFVPTRPKYQAAWELIQ